MLACSFGSFVIRQGIWTRIAKQSYTAIFEKGLGPDPLPPLNHILYASSICALKEEVVNCIARKLYSTNKNTISDNVYA